MYSRRNQKRMSANDMNAFIEAINATMRPSAAAPNYRWFVDLHERAMSHRMMSRWRVHSMGMGRDMGRNFLAWHRIYLLRFEERLREEDEGVALPYWNWERDPAPPPALSRAARLSRWNVNRNYVRADMPDTGDVRAAERRPRFPVFQQRLEAVHDWVHSAVGGNMVTGRSPADPLFWLHHANIDRIWARWQDKPENRRPANGPEDLQPRATMSSTVTQSLRIDRLGYRYS